jgi:hypothetical protein
MPLRIQQYQSALVRSTRTILGDDMARALSYQLAKNTPRTFVDQLSVRETIFKYIAMADMQLIMQDTFLDFFKENFSTEGEAIHSGFKKILIEQYGKGSFKDITPLVDLTLDKVEATFNLNHLAVTQLKISIGDINQQRHVDLTSEIAAIEASFIDLTVEDKVAFQLSSEAFESISAQLQSIIANSAQPLVDKYRLAEKVIDRVGSCNTG